MQYLIKEQIIVEATSIFDAFTSVCQDLDEAVFHIRPAAEKWSPAEHVRHMVVSTSTTNLAYTLPVFLVRWLGGRPNRDSMSYERLVEKYNTKLAAGGRASGRYVPKAKDISIGKDQLIAKWLQATAKFTAALKNNTSESKLDDYLVRHPLLGRITLRELCYFTIYHTEHHLNIIKGIVHPKPYTS